ncbi:hypothetical protein AB0F81_12520 [Actinoplanes sp. NPDC024001]|uniref:hypothetical protein n=1 Tax=Actinoplanes sp. NPDC024001 TaxID=3154598 RepID=UPI0033CF069C
MSRRQNTRQRAVAAYGVLRGRPARPDYGVLVVLPLVAAAGGALIGLGVESAVGRRTGERARSVPAAS